MIGVFHSNLEPCTDLTRPSKATILVFFVELESINNCCSNFLNLLTKSYESKFLFILKHKQTKFSLL